jgi:hypothetical protein
MLGTWPEDGATRGAAGLDLRLMPAADGEPAAFGVRSRSCGAYVAVTARVASAGDGSLVVEGSCVVGLVAARWRPQGHNILKEDISSVERM